MGLALGMNRSILLSLTTIGAVVGLFASAATFAAFTSSDTESGSVTAGSVTIDVFGSPGSALSFDPGATGCPTALAPGDTCTETVNVTNNGTLPVTISLAPGSPSISIVDSIAPAGCAAGDWSTLAGAFGDSTLAPGQTTTFTLDVTLLSAAVNGCQGETATVTATVDATS